MGCFIHLFLYGFTNVLVDMACYAAFLAGINVFGAMMSRAAFFWTGAQRCWCGWCIFVAVVLSVCHVCRRCGAICKAMCIDWWVGQAATPVWRYVEYIFHLTVAMHSRVDYDMSCVSLQLSVAISGGSGVVVVGGDKGPC